MTVCSPLWMSSTRDTVSEILEHVRNNQKVHFKFYRMGILYYETEKGLLFEVPISDAGTGIFNAEDKAINYMRWIRPQLRKNAEALAESQTATPAQGDGE